MVRRAFVLAAIALVSACGDGAGQQIEVHVVPTERARAEADSLDVILHRAGQERSYSLALPRPAPAGDWILDVSTRGWGSSVESIEAIARVGGSAIANGTAPAQGAIVASSSTRSHRSTGAEAARMAARSTSRRAI